MKKYSLIAIAALFLTGCSSVKKVEIVPILPDVVMSNAVDSMSYALGINMGADFAKNIESIPGGKSNIDLIIKGFSQAMKKDSTLLKPEVAQEYFRKYIMAEQARDNEAKKA
ncbi:MAG: hypothetical protein EOM44_09140, partial [Bacteroidia bacterium]|nr:hypothetical protein [Bacteroidia bacterium]